MDRFHRVHIFFISACTYSARNTCARVRKHKGAPRPHARVMMNFAWILVIIIINTGWGPSMFRDSTDLCLPYTSKRPFQSKLLIVFKWDRSAADTNNCLINRKKKKKKIWVWRVCAAGSTGLFMWQVHLNPVWERHKVSHTPGIISVLLKVSEKTVKFQGKPAVHSSQWTWSKSPAFFLQTLSHKVPTLSWHSLGTPP